MFQYLMPVLLSTIDVLIKAYLFQKECRNTQECLKYHIETLAALPLTIFTDVIWENQIAFQVSLMFVYMLI